MPVSRHRIHDNRLPPPHPDGPAFEPVPLSFAGWSWGRCAVWLSCPPPLTDRERAEALELMELGDHLVAEQRNREVRHA